MKPVPKCEELARERNKTEAGPVTAALQPQRRGHASEGGRARRVVCTAHVCVYRVKRHTRYSCRRD